MNEAIRQQMLRQCEAVDREGAAYLKAHPESPRFCYTCQLWLGGEAEAQKHLGHSIH